MGFSGFDGAGSENAEPEARDINVSSDEDGEQDEEELVSQT